MPLNVPIFDIIQEHVALINLNEKNMQRENPIKEKEYNSISVNLQAKVAHVLAKKSVQHNMTRIFCCLYSSKLCYSGF